MGVADRIAHEIKLEDERQRRQRAEQASRRAEPLVYKTTVTEQPKRTTTVIPPEVGPQETQIWWEWTNKRLAAQKLEIERNTETEFSAFHEAVGRALGIKARDLRNDLMLEDAVIRRDLDQLRRELEAQTRRIDDLRAEVVAAREHGARELSALREQIGVERGLRDLRSEVSEAQQQIPQLPAIVSQLQAETTSARTDADKRIAALERELKSTKERLSRARVEQSITSYNLAELQRAQQPVVELKFESVDGQFIMKDMHPDAAQAWRLFVREMVEANDGAMTPNDPTGRVIALPSRGAA